MKLYLVFTTINDFDFEPNLIEIFTEKGNAIIAAAKAVKEQYDTIGDEGDQFELDITEYPETPGVVFVDNKHDNYYGAKVEEWEAK